MKKKEFSSMVTMMLITSALTRNVIPDSRGGDNQSTTGTVSMNPVLGGQEISRIIPMNSGVIGIGYAPDQLPIRAVRNTHTIPETLPYVLFAPDSLPDSYNAILAQTQTLKAGITCDVAIFNKDRVRFTFVQGLNADTIDIFTDYPVSYPLVLKMLEKDWFISSRFQQVVGDGNTALQVGCAPMSFGQFALTGFVGANAIPMNTFRNGYQDQKNFLLSNKVITINSRRYLVFGMAATVVSPGDEVVTTAFDLDMYHSSIDFVGQVVGNLTK